MKNFIFGIILFFLFANQSGAVDLSLFKSETITDPLSFTVSIKNVGQGSCTIIRNHENNHFMIIDAGSLSDKPLNTEARLSEEFGLSEANTDVPLSDNTITVVVSHSDKDHINLFKSVFGPSQLLLEQIERVYLGDHFENYFRIPETREFLSTFVKRIPNVEEKLVSLSHDLTGLNISDQIDKDSLTLPRGKYYLFRDRVKGEGFLSGRQLSNSQNIFEVIGSNAGAGTVNEASPSETDTNINSAVVRLSIGGSNIIVMGDATGKTTEKILDAISDPTLLKAELLVASHHGAESEDTNHITWAAVTEPKRVALSSGFNKGYKHPTLTAIAHYLVAGLESEKLYASPLWEVDFSQSDMHELSVFNEIGRNIGSLKPHIRGLKWLKPDENHEEWSIFQTAKSIYSTNSSGELRYAFSAQGKLIHFWREY